ncbi:hypothetical protein DCF83_14920 [Edwardsiella tarda]|uniref:hypothetical protein n=1 Tax=Edwardsiella tarda TaxID=636 RepID=UPI0011B26F4D|nr:hypothetical protein [Edwardsiella tarda]UCQ27284.1 hypothetical protein DCF83_14920 [Edwardsiella tarda]
MEMKKVLALAIFITSPVYAKTYELISSDASVSENTGPHSGQSNCSLNNKYSITCSVFWQASFSTDQATSYGISNMSGLLTSNIGEPISFPQAPTGYSTFEIRVGMQNSNVPMPNATFFSQTAEVASIPLSGATYSMPDTFRYNFDWAKGFLSRAFHVKYPQLIEVTSSASLPSEIKLTNTLNGMLGLNYVFSRDPLELILKPSRSVTTATYRAKPENVSLVVDNIHCPQLDIGSAPSRVACEVGSLNIIGSPLGSLSFSSPSVMIDDPTKIGLGDAGYATFSIINDSGSNPSSREMRFNGELMPSNSNLNKMSGHVYSYGNGRGTPGTKTATIKVTFTAN